MKITIPEFSLVVLIGPSGSGKSTFAKKHFLPSEVLSSDFCRALISDDENNQSVTPEAFELLHFIAAKRLSGRRLTVIDATHVQAESRKPLVALARDYHALLVAVVLNVPESICKERNRTRSDRNFGDHVIRQQHQQMQKSLRNLEREGFRHVYVLSSPEEIETAILERQPLWNNRSDEHGPFDIIGDIHGCRAELEALLDKLGYDPISKQHPAGRKVIFLGDLVDRGPDTPGVLRIVMRMVANGQALCVPGNHETKLLRKLWGKPVQITHGLAESLAQLEQQPPEFLTQVREFIDGLVSHYVLDDGKLVVAHAGMKESLQGRASMQVREFAMYGETTGETDEFGLPIRYNWAAEYRGKAMVVYGHTPVPEPEWLNHTINIDTGCVFGGKLTALRYPEKEFVSVPAEKVWFEPIKPLVSAPRSDVALTMQQSQDEILDLDDVLGKRIVTTRLHKTVTIREENGLAAIEAMSRFAINPKWLIYLPPTMSPCETAKSLDLLEHPAQAFAYYRKEGIPQVICEEKHMGSRAIILLCQSPKVAQKRFGIREEEIGVCYTRTGRRFFQDLSLEKQLLSWLQNAVERANLWDNLNTDWICLDTELMPWSAKAQELIRSQYAAVGTAARVSLGTSEALLTQTQQRGGLEVASLRKEIQIRSQLVQKYVEAYRRYCWPINSIKDYRIAPFHILATEGNVHADKNHLWHLQTLARLCESGEPILMKTAYHQVDVTKPESELAGVDFWESILRKGGEGMVVKPFEFTTRGSKGLAQPAIKCRGPEYLRIIYGPEYSLPENLERLRSRALATKRSLALREFALGIEAFERFVRHEPLRRVHECVFGILALESEPVDPRL